jgi:fatty acid desaturase
MTTKTDLKTDLQTISSLVGDALFQFNKLLQNEIELAKAELAEKAQQVSGALGFLAGGAVLVIPAIVMALFALSAALIANGWSQPVAYLASALLAAIVAVILFAVGMHRLDAGHLKPAETIRQLDKDKAAVKGVMR